MALRTLDDINISRLTVGCLTWLARGTRWTYPAIPLAIRLPVKLLAVHTRVLIYRNQTAVSFLEPEKNCSSHRNVQCYLSGLFYCTQSVCVRKHLSDNKVSGLLRTVSVILVSLTVMKLCTDFIKFLYGTVRRQI